LRISHLNLVFAVGFVLTLNVSGCRTGNSIFKVTDPMGTYNTTDDAITDAVAHKLSGGKIDSYTYIPGLPADRQEKSLLQACRGLRLNSRTAKSTYLMIKHRGKVSGVTQIEALVVGDKILIVVGSFARFVTGATGVTRFSCSIFPTDDPVPITANATKVSVGGVIVRLNNPVIQNHPNNDIVIVWSDLFRVIQEHDKRYPSNGRTIQDWWLANSYNGHTIAD